MSWIAECNRCQHRCEAKPITVNLFLKLRECCSVRMLYDGARFICKRISCCEHLDQHRDVLASTRRGTNAKRFVESAPCAKLFGAECHVGAKTELASQIYGADLLRLRRVRAARHLEVPDVLEGQGFVTAVKTVAGLLEQDLRLRLKFQWHHQAGHCSDIWFPREPLAKGSEPAAVHHYVVISESYYVACRGRYPTITRCRDPGSWLADYAYPRNIDGSCFAESVIYNDYFIVGII